MINRVHSEHLKAWHIGHDHRRIENALRHIERDFKLREVPGRHYQLPGQQPPERARTALQRLVERGLVEPRGGGRGRSYHLSANTYRRLGKEAAYVRQRGFEPLQQAQMVLNYVDSHGSISRQEVADLCRVSAAQAYHLLKKLVDEDRLVKTALRGRNMRYRKAE